MFTVASEVTRVNFNACGIATSPMKPAGNLKPFVADGLEPSSVMFTSNPCTVTKAWVAPEGTVIVNTPLPTVWLY
jgi:hypothetical protein